MAHQGNTTTVGGTPAVPAVPVVPAASDSRSEGRGLSRRAAIMLSFVCPGLGQLVRRKWVTGACQLVLFLGGLVTAIAPVLLEIVRIYRSAFAIVDHPHADLATFDTGVFVPLAVGGSMALVAFLWSLWDAGKKPVRDRC